jgi:cardiolipin synthase
MNSTPELLLPAAYVADVTKHIKLAKKRVCLLSMILADDSSTDELVDELSAAAERGVDVRLAADIFTYGELGGFLLPTRHRARQSRATSRLGRRLIKSGVNFTWLGKSHTTIISGRTHVKMCVIDDDVYSFGGVNLYLEGIDNNDYMFKIKDDKLADLLINEYRRLIRADARGQTYKSHEIDFGKDKILIDGGFVGDSIIYRRACKLSREAESIILVSQYCTTGKLSRILKSKNAKLYFNSPANAEGFNKTVIRIGMFLTRNNTLYSKSKYLHAKFIIFNMPDGRKIVLTGSHNFVNAGVLLGTREIALQTENPQVIKQLEDFLKKYIF